MRRIGIALLLAAAAGVAVPVLAGAREVGAPTYYGAVGSILNAKCAGCHVDGGVAPFALTSAQDAQRYAHAIAAVAQAGTMPPWPPGRDSAHFVGQSARILTAQEQQTLAAWAAAGAPAGAKRALPAPPAKPLPAFGSRVLTLRPAQPYTPRARNGALDDYRCFLLDPRLSRSTYVTAATIEPGARALVHHVILFEAAGAQADAATRLDAASGGTGWPCFGGPNLPVEATGATATSLRFGSPQWLAAWVPGHVTDALPAGKGVLVHRGAKIVMQVHYNLVHGTRADRSRAVLTTAPPGAKVRPLETMLLAAPVELPCPKGTRGPRCRRSAALAALTRQYGSAFMPTALLFLCGKTVADAGWTTSCDRQVPRRLTIYGLAGHMHLRGRDVSIVLDPGTPRQRTLLHIPGWDFRWQDAYFLQRPVTVGPNDVLRLSCRFDNSRAAQPATAPTPRYVVWGEGTTDEMCLGALSVALG